MFPCCILTIQLFTGESEHDNENRLGLGHHPGLREHHRVCTAVDTTKRPYGRVRTTFVAGLGHLDAGRREGRRQVDGAKLALGRQGTRLGRRLLREQPKPPRSSHRRCEPRLFRRQGQEHQRRGPHLRRAGPQALSHTCGNRNREDPFARRLRLQAGPGGRRNPEHHARHDSRFTIHGALGPTATKGQVNGLGRGIQHASVSYLAPLGSGLRVDLGKFVTHIGGETIETVKNWNYSHAFFYTYAIPFQDTGARLNYNWSDTLYTEIYVVNGWNVTHDNNSGRTWGPSVGWTKNYPELGAAYSLKEGFYGIYEGSGSPQAAIAAYEAWNKAVVPEVRDAYSDLIRAWTKWQPWILGYFDHPVTNAYTESLNSLIRVMNRLGRGYSFEALRAKILFTEGGVISVSVQKLPPSAW
ncbi:MAG: hypothetical protein EKK47_12175 [Burkholderiales bacterium]|nr:MAG: hypothetical protein EKK47_12175 [Burkholderiales bacterium]